MNTKINTVLLIRNKQEVFDQTKNWLKSNGLDIEDMDMNRPWGGFFVISPIQLKKFKSLFFEEVKLTDLQENLKMSPKILLVAPEQKLSWQYHHRRSELWKLVAGKANYSRSKDNFVEAPIEMITGQLVHLEREERHRLIGSKEWGIVAEIWIHSDINNPSDENDIVRLEDDYNRK